MALRRAKKIEAVEATGPARVLVVHDDRDGCELLVRILAVAGHDVARAHGFVEMMEVLQDSPHPTGVLLDVGTGGIGGNLKLLDAVRNHRDATVSGARVVLVAGSASSAMFSWQAGIDEFLQRPFHADDLITAMADALDRPEDDRRQHRRRQLDAITESGRR